MEFSRRDYVLAALGSALVPAAGWGLISGRSSSAAPSRPVPYRSTLEGGLTPRHLEWIERKWRCAMGSTWNPGMDHCLRLTADRARFEIRDTDFDRGQNDPAKKRRSEIRNPNRPRLPNGVPLWSAMTFIHQHYADPRGMADKGGAHGQIHIGSTFGGSPAVASRRIPGGEFAVTTRGEHEQDNTIRYRGALSFDEPHDLVFRVLLHPTNGALAVWLDGRPILNLNGVSIGSNDAECYWSIGCYFGGGITCPVVAEFGNLVYPAPVDLRARIKRRPGWPYG